MLETKKKLRAFKKQMMTEIYIKLCKILDKNKYDENRWGVQFALTKRDLARKVLGKQHSRPEFKELEKAIIQYRKNNPQLIGQNIDKGYGYYFASDETDTRVYANRRKASIIGFEKGLCKSIIASCSQLGTDPRSMLLDYKKSIISEINGIKALEKKWMIEYKEEETE